MKKLIYSFLAVCAGAVLIYEGKHWALLSGLGQGGVWGLRAKYEQSLDLYGMVLEEQSQTPIAGATVELSANDNPSFAVQETTRSFVQTDAQGRFFYTGHRGAYLYVAVSKEGFYQLEGRSRTTFTHDTPSPGMQEQSFAPDSAQPARLFLRAPGKVPPKLVMHRLSPLLPPDGSPAELRLAYGVMVMLGKGNVQLACTGNDRGIPGGVPYDWSCQISVPGGGLQVRTDPFAFQAPEGGYQPGEFIDMPASLGKGKWHDVADRDYFLHLANGCYARMKIEMCPGGHHLAYLTYYYNPTPGDRNLEAGSNADPEYR